MADEPAIRVADFFCGCGGTSAGLRAAGMTIAAAVDFDAEAAATYRANFPGTMFFERDIRRVSPEEVRDAVAGDGPLLVSACAPCQPFSSLRGSEAKVNRRDKTLLLRLLPFIEHLDPELVFIENVPGIQAVKGSSAWARFRRALERAGYEVDWDVIDCKRYGVPQRRRRLILMASKLDPITLPPATHGPDGLPYSTVGEWIGELPAIKAGETHSDVANHRAGALGKLSLKRIQALEEGQGRHDWPEELRLRCHDDHRGHSDVYGRMSMDGQAPVLTTKCTSLSNGRFGHPVQDRAISVREAACLQTFPHTFSFEGNLRSATRQVGNAVPVLLAQRVGEAFVAHVSAQLAGAEAGGGSS